MANNGESTPWSLALLPKSEKKKNRKNSTFDQTQDANPTTEFSVLTKSNIRPLVDLNDKINSLTSHEENIHSTRIVVAGDQSHGKTSLLEALSGIDLPRGEGIQTRVPLILKLRKANDEEQQYASIKIASWPASSENILLSQIGDKVREYTVKAAGGGKEVKDEPLELTVFRVDQDDLTLIDLPGITRVAQEDQAGGDGRKLEQLIMKLCRKYMEPKQSILLNVVSAMVDFSTSASLQLSRELDPEGSRTIMCVTKIDQHEEKGIQEKLAKASRMMRMKPDHIYVVRNRTQQENDDDLSLKDVRVLETNHLGKMFGNENVRFGLGVSALSKKLVQIQCDQIMETLPRTKVLIDEQINVVEKELMELGTYVDNGSDCRYVAAGMIDTFMASLEDQRKGSKASSDNNSSSFDGMSFELSWVVDIEDERKKTVQGDSITSDKYSMGEYELTIKLNPRGKKDGNNGVGMFLVLERMPSWIKTAKLSYTLSVIDSDEDNIKTSTYEYKFEKCESRGRSNFIPEEIAKTLKGPTTFRISATIIEEETKSKDFHSPTFLGKLSLQDDVLKTNINMAYSNMYFFSESFGIGLEQQVNAYRSSVEMRGSIARHIPVEVMQRLRDVLPKHVENYRNNIYQIWESTISYSIEDVCDVKAYPQLKIFFSDNVNTLLDEQMAITADFHDRLLGLEEEICTGDHYYMDTVQSIRSYIFGETTETSSKPRYLKDLNPTNILKMSIEKQRLLDMQIEIFAYWELVKKRVIDNILLSTRSELVTKLLNLIKKSLMQKVIKMENEDLLELFSPDDEIAKKRKVVLTRLEKLKEARLSVETYYQGWEEE